MKQFTLGKYTLDDFADYLNGNNNYFEGIEGGELVIEGEHKLSKTINMHFPLTITGKKATISGEGLGAKYGFAMTASNTTVQNIDIVSAINGVDVDAVGKLAENITIKNIHMIGGGIIVETGSTKSNSTLKNVVIDGCCHEVQEKHEWGDVAMEVPVLPYSIECARYKDEHIDNCVLDGLTINNCQKLGGSRIGVNIMSACVYNHDYSNCTFDNYATHNDKKYSNLAMRNLTITNCKVELCWDGALAVVGGDSNDMIIDNINVSNNYAEHGICGLYVMADAHLLGEGHGSGITNFVVRNNHFVRTVADIGEPVRSVWFNASRSDFFPGVISNDNYIDNVEISGNKIDGGGIVVTGAYSLLDAVSQYNNNVVSNVRIFNNTILNTDEAFRFEGAQLEGRLFDWQFGYPPRNTKWGEAITDDSTVTMVMTNNRVENLTVTDNTIEGYRYRVIAAGATGHGHGVCTDNKVCGNNVFERNIFGTGENHLHVADVIIDDFVVDNGGNSVDKVFKN